MIQIVVITGTIKHGFIAHWLEHWSCKPELVSSILTGAIDYALEEMLMN